MFCLFSQQPFLSFTWYIGRVSKKLCNLESSSVSSITSRYSLTHIEVMPVCRGNWIVYSPLTRYHWKPLRSSSTVSGSRLGPFLKRKTGAVSQFKELQFHRLRSNSLVHSDHCWCGKLTEKTNINSAKVSAITVSISLRREVLSAPNRDVSSWAASAINLQFQHCALVNVACVSSLADM